ncbi:hypothetical protein MTO96_037184, partial [Rhipicephalus appendiculatus]
MFVFITTDITMSAARLDIKEFVGTSEKIWTVKTTNRERMKCEVDQLKSMRTLSIVFERSSFIRGRRRDLRLRGVFDTRYKRRMTLFYKGSFISTETMVYMDPDQSCAVFKIESLRDSGVDIKQFVNQFEPLWTYKTTNTGHIKCEVDQLVSIRPLSITFKRSVFVRGSRCDFRIRGVFDRHHKERMTLFYN